MSRTKAVELENRYRELFFSGRSANLPPLLEARRTEYIEDFVLSGIPDKKDEHYRMVDMRALWSYPWQPAPSSGNYQRLPLGNNHMELSNGVPRNNSLVELEGGVLFGSLSAAALDLSDVVQEHLNSVAPNKSSALTAINSAFVEQGAIIYLPHGSEGEFTINLHYDSQEAMPLLFSRLLVVAERGSRAQITISYTSCGEDMLINHVSEFCLAQGADVKINEITTLSEGTMAIISNYCRQGHESSIKQISVEMGCKMLRRSFTNNVEGSGAQSEYYDLFLATGTQLCDVNTSQAHLVPNSSSTQVIKGMASDNAIGSATGRVYVEKDAQKTLATQQFRLMQLTPTAKLFTRPQLEIYADDVKCSHGASIGSLDEQALFYIRQRGLDQQAARRLQMTGFGGQVIMKIENRELAEYIQELIDNRIEML